MAREYEPQTTTAQRLVLERCDYFTDVQLLPVRDVLDPDGWLQNFHADELPYAVRMLDFFMYFSERVVDALLYTAFQRLSHATTPSFGVRVGPHDKWRTFVDTVLLTYVTGENPNVTDSGYTFARKARQVLGIPEDRVVPPQKALAEVLQVPRPVVFVDDFVGSGSQCISTWHRQYPVFASATRSFADIAQLMPSAFYYCPVICTKLGLRNIHRYCPGLTLEPAHVLDRRYSVLSSTSLAWNTQMRGSAYRIIRKASDRAGIPDTKGRDVDDWQGFRKLGLAIAFHNSVPDATIPLFYWERNGWVPLLRRR